MQGLGSMKRTYSIEFYSAELDQKINQYCQNGTRVLAAIPIRDGNYTNVIFEVDIIEEQKAEIQKLKTEILSLQNSLDYYKRAYDKQHTVKNYE